jgi:hypothetical protein
MAPAGQTVGLLPVLHYIVLGCWSRYSTPRQMHSILGRNSRMGCYTSFRHLVGFRGREFGRLDGEVWQKWLG